MCQDLDVLCKEKFISGKLYISFMQIESFTGHSNLYYSSILLDKLQYYLFNFCITVY